MNKKSRSLSTLALTGAGLGAGREGEWQVLGQAWGQDSARQAHGGAALGALGGRGERRRQGRVPKVPRPTRTMQVFSCVKRALRCVGPSLLWVPLCCGSPCAVGSVLNLPVRLEGRNLPV